MTLPERVLNLLAEIHPDRARAVTQATLVAVGDQALFKPVELIEMSPGQSLIVVGPSQALRTIHWLKLIEIAPTRHLLAFLCGTPIERVEAVLRDLSRQPRWMKHPDESRLLRDLLTILGHHRQTNRMFKAEILIIDTQP